jgi:hypothetical protein
MNEDTVSVKARMTEAEGWTNGDGDGAVTGRNQLRRCSWPALDAMRWPEFDTTAIGGVLGDSGCL